MNIRRRKEILLNFHLDEGISLRIAMGLMAGLLSVVGLTYVLWFYGISITKYHWLSFPSGFILSGLILWRKKWVSIVLSGGVILFVLWLWSLCCSHLYGLNWDGMLTHKEYVMALDGGWNPVLDPFYNSALGNSDWERNTSYHKIEWGGYNVRFGYVYQAVLAKATNSIESAKATNLLFLFLPFFIALYALRQWEVNPKTSFFLAVVIALNPVWILQSVSFWEDAQFAGISISSVLLAMILCRTEKINLVVVFALSLVLLVGAKRSGIGFSMTLIATIVIVRSIRVIRKPFSGKMLIYLVLGASAMLVSFIIGHFLGLWKSHGLFPYKTEQILEISQISHFFSDQFLEKIPKLASLHGPLQFMGTVLSEGSMVVSDIAFKPLFAVSKQEYDLYFYVFTALWFGGFGPWYGSCLLMLVVAFFASARMFNPLWWKRSVFFPWVLFLIGIMWVMPVFFIRWIPFLWILPILLYLSIWEGTLLKEQKWTGSQAFLVSRYLVNLKIGSRFWEFFAFSMMVVLMLNSFLTLSLNLIGHVRASNVVLEQLEFAESYLPKPIKVSFADFASNREWLDSKGIDWVSMEAVEEDQSYMRLARTNTCILLDGFDLEKPVVIRGTQWKSIMQWRDSMNRRTGLRERWGAWIGDTVVITGASES